MLVRHVVVVLTHTSRDRSGIDNGRLSRDTPVATSTSNRYEVHREAYTQHAPVASVCTRVPYSDDVAQ